MMVYCAITEAKTRKEKTVSSTVLSAKKKPVEPDRLTLKKFSKAQKKTDSADNGPSG